MTENVCCQSNDGSGYTCKIVIISDSDYFDELDDDELERLEEAAKVLDMEEEVGNCPLLFLIMIIIIYMRCALLSC